MKSVSPALASYLATVPLAGDAALYFCDLYTITLQSGSIGGIANGQVLAYSSLDVPVAWNGYTYLANSLLVSGLKYKCSTGVEADAQTITISAYSSMKIGGIPFLQAIQQGLLRGAEIQRERAFFQNFGGGSPMSPLVPIGTVILFRGRVTKLQVGRTTSEVTVESDLTLLKPMMPRKFFAPPCSLQLYGAQCGVIRASYTFTGAAGSGSTASVINWSGASLNFQQGSLTFTSGANEGITANIKAAVNATSLTLMYPLPAAPAVGDTFTVVWGCDHTYGAQFTGSITGGGTTLNVPAAPIGLIGIGAQSGLLFGASVPAGAYVTGQLTGSVAGGAGTYSLSGVAVNISSESMGVGGGCAKFFNQANFVGFPRLPPAGVITGPLATTANAGKG